MVKLSAALIVKNENHNGFRDLLRVCNDFCDEIIVVDTGSTDGTPQLAADAGAQVHHFTWCDDFAAARNFAFSECSGDWIVWFDADDVLPEATIAIAQRIKNELLPVITHDAVRAVYNYDHATDGTPTIVQMRERFIRRGFKWVGLVHEVIDGLKSWVDCPEFVVEHRPSANHTERKVGRNLGIYDLFLDAQKCSLRDLFLYACELRGAGRFQDAIRTYDLYEQRYDREMTAQGFHETLEEAYVALVNRTECYRQLKRWDAAIRSAMGTAARNPARAEAYALAAITLYDLQAYAGAFPLFLAAAACKPPKHGGVVYMAFYAEAIREMVEDCALRLEVKP
jgi:glycosyltransferase involved in cell wall biosynthesis